MKQVLRITIAGAVLTALVVPALALGQSSQSKSAAKPTSAPTLAESPTSGFPEKAYLLALPAVKRLTASKVSVTENGSDVSGLTVAPPGGDKSGAILLIDASNSMKGVPIQPGDGRCARLPRRAQERTCRWRSSSSDPTTPSSRTSRQAGQELEASVSKTPTTAEGTHIYDALTNVAGDGEGQGLERTTVVLLSDGTDVGSTDVASPTLWQAATDAHVRVISVGLSLRSTTRRRSRASQTARAASTSRADHAGRAPAHLQEIGQQLSSEYELTYRSLLPPDRQAKVVVKAAGYPAATAAYTTPNLNLQPQGTFERDWIDGVITSPWLMIFVIVAVLALIAFAIFSAIDVRNRSLRRRMAQYVTVPSEEESRLRRAEVSGLLADTAQKTVGGQRWWQRFETDVELGGYSLSPLAIAGWTIVAGIFASLAFTLYFHSLWFLLVGIAAPFITRWLVSRRVTKVRKNFMEQLPDNLDVLAGAMRTGHSTMGALSVMVDSAVEPSKGEFRRVVQDEQLGVSLDDSLMVMARRMESYDAEQIALVMRLQREAGGNTAEVLDRVAEVIRGRMELRRLVEVLTAQARISRWILTGLPLFVLFALFFTGGDYLQPMLDSLLGKIALVVGAIMVMIGSFWIKQIAKLDV